MSDELQFILPPGMKLGCLPRESKVGQYAPVFSEHIKVLSLEECDEIIVERKAAGELLEGRLDVNEIKYQNGVGSCFPSGTLIRMKDGSEKPIEKVALLDEVVTAEGRTGRVLNTMVRDHDDTMCRLLLNGCRHVRMTPEHPVLTERGYVTAANLVKNDMVAFPRYMPQSATFILTLDYVWSRRHTGSRRTMRSKAGSVRTLEIPGKAAAVISRRPLPDIIHLTKGFGRIIGLFLAEGCTSYGKVIWTFGAHEKDTLASELSGLLESELGVIASMQVRGRNTVKVNVHGVHWAMLFESLCSKLSHGKRLHPDIAEGPKDFLCGVLSGWTDGDGIGPGKLGGSTVSHAMAVGMFDIANAVGFKPTIRVRQPKLSHGVKSRKPVWIVEWGHGTLVQKNDYRKRQTDTHLWRRVESVEYEDFTGPVFNIEVEGDHSYVAEGIGVHNCAFESTTQAYEVIAERSGYPWVKLNPWTGYRQATRRDDGSTIDGNLVIMRDVGIVPDAYFPRYDDNGRQVHAWHESPPVGWQDVASEFRIDEWYDVNPSDYVREIATGLVKGFVAVIGWSRHSEVMVDYLGGGIADVANSYAVTYGDRGFHKELIRKVNTGYGMFMVRTVVDRKTPPQPQK